MPRQPMAEVFGFRIDDFSAEAQLHRQQHLCPFNNNVPACTKDKAADPLGVCSIFDGGNVTITCPIRFRQDWLIERHAAEFFFPPRTLYRRFTEIRLNDGTGRSAGNIDVVLVAFNDQGQLIDFGVIEVQSVYVSGNIRQPFAYYMQDPTAHSRLDWSRQSNYPRPDYLSSSRKRLAPQLLYKGGILHAWGRKTAVVVDEAFFARLPALPQVPIADAEVAWFVYDLQLNAATGRYQLVRTQTVYTAFLPVLERITTSEAGPEDAFRRALQKKLDRR